MYTIYLYITFNRRSAVTARKRAQYSDNRLVTA